MSYKNKDEVGTIMDSAFKQYKRKTPIFNSVEEFAAYTGMALEDRQNAGMVSLTQTYLQIEELGVAVDSTPNFKDNPINYSISNVKFSEDILKLVRKQLGGDQEKIHIWGQRRVMGTSVSQMKSLKSERSLRRHINEVDELIELILKKYNYWK